MSKASSWKALRPAERKIERVIAVMPAYNASTTLEATLRDIPHGSVEEVILVDDASTDDTVAVAQALGITVIRHPTNLGYGGNQKTCYDAALERGADVVIMIHPDYQYDSRIIPHAVGFIATAVCDIVLGSRIRSRREALEGGMPLYKYIGNRILTILENVVLGQNLGDFHSGFRVYTREALQKIPYRHNSDDFVFDSQLLAQAVYLGLRIGDVPIPTRYFADASSINFRRSVSYGIGTLGVLGRYVAARMGVVSRLLPSGTDEPRAPIGDA